MNSLNLAEGAQKKERFSSFFWGRKGEKRGKDEHRRREKGPQGGFGEEKLSGARPNDRIVRYLGLDMDSSAVGYYLGVYLILRHLDAWLRLKHLEHETLIPVRLLNL